MIGLFPVPWVVWEREMMTLSPVIKLASRFRQPWLHSRRGRISLSSQHLCEVGKLTLDPSPREEKCESRWIQEESMEELELQ